MAATLYYQPQFMDVAFGDVTADYSALNGSTKLKCMLLTGTATARATTEGWKFLNTATTANAELSATGYTAGGQTCTGVTYSTTNLVSSLSLTIPAWTSATWTTATMAVVYDSTSGTNTTEPILLVIDFGGAQSVTAGTFTITLSSPAVTWTTNA